MSKEIYFKSKSDWRDWLEKNHIKESKVSIINYKKHTGKPSISHRESMEEAICFGWIDTTIKRLDEDRYLRKFSKRSKNSKWSTNTLSYAKDMIKQNKMSPQGLHYFKEGLKRPTLDSEVSKNPQTPEDLRSKLENHKIAKENFAKFPPSSKKMFLRWLERAKQPQTREKRIAFIIKKAESNNKKFL